MSRYIRTGRDNWQPRPPQTDARRLETNGPLNLQPADTEYDGSEDFRAWLFVAGALAIALLLIFIFGGQS